MFIKEKDFQKFIGGDEKSFELIFHQYYKTLVSFVMRHGIEQMKAEDITIEVFHRIWLMREKLQSPGGLHSLLFTAVHNRALNLLRDIHKQGKIVEEHIAYDEVDNIDDLLMEEEISRALNDAVAQLSGQSRFVILELLAGKSTQDIAEKMKISVSAVKTYKARAIDILRDLLKDSAFLLLLVLVEEDVCGDKTQKN